jgi:glucokinase
MNAVYLGVDIGGTKCAVSAGTSQGEILDRAEVATNPASDPMKILDGLVLLASDLAQRHDLQGVGISCGGPLDRERGLILSPPNLPLWTEVPVRSAFESAFPGLPVTVENDANATALAEHRWGAGQGCAHMVFMTVGTGIGGGLILDGKLYRGARDLAGELGHQTILIDGPLCGCGKKGCLEALASGPAIARLARESLLYGRGKTLLSLARGKPGDITARHVVEAAKAGDAFSVKILEEVGTYLGIGIANAIQLMNPERVVLGTIAVHAGELLLGPVRDAIARHAWPMLASPCAVVPAGLGDRAQDLAAIAVACSRAAQSNGS